MAEDLLKKEALRNFSFFAQITSKFCPLCAKKSFKIDGRNCQIKSVMSTERAPQILQERLTLQLKHLNEFWGHSQ
jgi:hypothetical protein